MRGHYDDPVLDDSRGTDRPLERELGSSSPGGDAEADASPDDGGRSESAPADWLRDRSGWHIAAVCAVVLTVAGLLWIGSELHYQGCLQRAEVRNPGQDNLSRLVRLRDVENCSRLPF